MIDHKAREVIGDYSAGLIDGEAYGNDVLNRIRDDHKADVLFLPAIVEMFQDKERHVPIEWREYDEGFQRGFWTRIETIIYLAVKGGIHD